MKRCPECSRDYNDDSMSFCLDDGSELLFGPASGSEPGAIATGFPSDEPQTAILHSTAAPGEAPTRAQIQMTDQTAVLPIGTGDVSKSKGFDKRLVLAPLALAVIVLGGFFGYRYITPAKQIESIAVMPFVNESGNPDVEYLSDGMTETLINSLSKLPNLKVMSRGSVFHYKGTETDPKKIGAELGVGATLTGRLKQVGDQLIISVSLDDTQDGHRVWGEQYTRKISDLLSLQSELARDVSAKLKSKLSGSDVAKVEKSSTTNPEAYQLYLKGRFSWNTRTIESLKQAAEFYKQAIEKDPNFALAYAGLAETYVLFPVWNIAPTNESMPQAKVAALKALELDDSLAEPHVALGQYHIYYEFDRVAGEREFRRAIELNPDYATAHQWLGTEALLPIKRFDEAIAALRRAEELDPLSAIIGARLADTYGYERRYDEAIAQYKRTLSLNPNFGYARQQLGWAYGLKGMYAEAIAESRRAIELNPDPAWRGYLAMWLAKSGDQGEARKLLDELKRESNERYVPSFAISLVYIGLGEKEEALTWLEKEVSDRGFDSNYFLVSPELDDLRSEPRFKAMLKRLSLPE